MKLSKMLLSLFSIAALGSKADPVPGPPSNRDVSLIGTDVLNCSVELGANLTIRDDFSDRAVVDVENKAMQDLLAVNNFSETAAPLDRSQNKTFSYPTEVIHDGGEPAVTIRSFAILSAPAVANFTLCLLNFANSTLPTLAKKLRNAAQDEMTRESDERTIEAFEIGGIIMGVAGLILAACYCSNKFDQKRKAEAEVRQPLNSGLETYGALEIEVGSGPRR